jgi:ribosomal protein S18 acetylase RimI-like enzyme
MTEILKAIKEDLSLILELQKLAYRSEAKLYNDFSLPPLLQTIEEVENQFRDHIFLKAVLNNRIIGSVRAMERGGTCYIGRLVVHPDFQNQGIGKSLMNEIEKIFNNVNRFELFTGSISYKNISYYKKLGYKICKFEKVSDILEFAYMEKIKSLNNEKSFQK